MTPEQIKAAVEALTPLAEKLGTTVEYIYSVYRAYQWHYAVANLVTPVIVIALMLLSWVLIGRWGWAMVRTNRGGDDGFFAYCVGVVLAIVAPVVLIWIGGVSEDSYLRLTNPDYYAIQSMLKLVGK